MGGNQDESQVSYLGDGLYVRNDHYQIALIANSHEEPTDTVYLNGAVFQALLEFIKHRNIFPGLFPEGEN